MATLSQTVAKGVRVYEAEVTLPTASGTVTAVSIPANCMVLAAGAVITEACAGSSAHVADLSIGAADTIDVVSTVTGTGTAGKARIYALVVDMTAPRTADEVDRDTLA
jgi:hypothetical protein